MADYQIENEEIKAVVSDMGAQLISLVDKATGTEYMWCRDKQYWGKCSPVLFPFIGRCMDKEYTYKGKTYPMTIHGFASDSVFEAESHKDKLTFTLRDSEETLKIYPFKFTLTMEYTLKGRSLNIGYRVKNENEDEMYFMLGAHPGFNCPIDKDLKRRDCFVKFHGMDEIVSRGVDLDHGLVNEVYTVFGLKDECLPITDNLFEGDALLMENQGINKVSLTGPDKKPFVTVTMEASVYGIWSHPTPGMPYVCIEPWCGRCDSMNFEKELTKKDFVNRIDGGEEWLNTLTIEI